MTELAHSSTNETLVGLAPRGARRVGWVPVAAALALVLVLNGLGAGMLRSTYISGWIAGVLLVFLSLGSLGWTDGVQRRRRVRSHLGWLCVLTLLFFLHVGLRLPHGWIDRAIFVLFLALPVSALSGYRLASRDGRERFGNWLVLHVVLIFALTSLVVFHGAFAHAHGVMAHWRDALGG